MTLEVKVSETQTLQEINTDGKNYFVGNKRVYPRVVSQPITYNISSDPKGLSDDNEEPDLVLPRHITEAIVLGCFESDESKARIGNASRSNGFIVWDFKRYDVRRSIKQGNDYVRISDEFSVQLQFYRY
tara:strand:+ start:7668 stop:8054 length:387 start_codon:yes stop_codon:yes gene_type:complete